MSLLNVIDENENIIGQEERKLIHEKGLLHREIHVFFSTVDQQIIFQKRGKNKDTFPNLLDATAGGHVELDDNYLDTAIKEVKEETGLDIVTSDLILLGKLRKSAKDQVTYTTNNVIRAVYLYKFQGKLSDLKIEGDLGQGFEIYPIQLLTGIIPNEVRARFVPTLLDEDYIKIYKMIGEIL